MDINIMVISVAALSLITSTIFGIITVNSKKNDTQLEVRTRHKKEIGNIVDKQAESQQQCKIDSQKKFDNIWEKLKDHDEKLEQQIRIEETLKNVCEKIDKMMLKLDI